MFLPQVWDDDDRRYVRNAVLIGAGVAVITEPTKFALERLGKEHDKRVGDSNPKAEEDSNG